MALNIYDLNLQLEKFEPFFNFETAHTQTLLGHFIKSPIFTQALSHELVELPDGDMMGVKIHHNESPYIVAIFHGLGGDSSSDYMQRTARIADSLGLSVALVEHRGVGLSEGRAVKPYHSGRGDDASNVSLFLRKKFPMKKQIFIGYSLSGSVLLNLVTGRSGDYLPDYAIVVNAPIVLSRASAMLQKGFSKLYDFRFYMLLKKIIRRKDPNLKMPLLGTTQLIDKLYTSRNSGFKNEEEYYQTCSTYPHLNKIKIPTFVLTSEDDPFITFLDYEKADWNLKTHRTFVKHGGHMGYISKKKIHFFQHRWLDHYIHQVFQQILKID